MALGLAFAILVTARLAKRDQPRWPGWLDGLIIIALFALIGGRAGFVLANRAYFMEEPGQIGLVWQGGLSYHGALLAGLLGLFMWSIWRRRSFIDYAGLMVAGLVLMSAFGWLACYLEGCAYGRETTFGFLAGDLSDAYGVFGLRYQTQLMGLALCLILFPFVVAGHRHLRPAYLFGLSLILLSLIHLIVSLFRGDEVPLLGSLRWDTLLDGTIAVTTLLLLLFSIASDQLRDRRELRSGQTG
jgi:phosphatidylglycerol:prolipoprotein diacylglycerol transferase